MAVENGVTMGVSYVIYAEDALGELVKIAGQRGGSLEMTTGSIDISSKDSDQAWYDAIAGQKSWSISTDALLVINEESGYELLEEAFLQGKRLPIELSTPSASKFKGNVLVESLSMDLNHDDTATYSVSLTGLGALERVPVVPGP